jgi:hypothetical protein
MGISGGPDMIQDGLVLALDAADVFLPVNRNLLTYTNDLSNATWGKIRSQITASAATAPDGTNTAFAMTITDATGLVRLSQSPISASIVGGPYTFSVYLKQNNISASLFDTGIYNTSTTSGSEPSYNILNNFAVTGSSGGYVSNRTVTSVGNGWYRVATTATIANNSSWYLFFDIEAGSGTKTNGQSLYLWGPQFEYGTVATEYQPVNVTTRIWPNLVNQSVSGSLLNNPAFDPSNRGSIVFDGVNDYVTGSSVINAGSNFSVFAWIKPGAINVRNGIVGNSYSYATRQGFLLSTATNYGGTNNTFFISIGADDAYRTANNNSITLNTWNYVGGAVTNGGQDIKLYVNGIETSYFGGTLSSGSILYDINQLLIGARHSATLEPFIGSIATTQIYNRILTSSEILQNYNAQKSRFNL